MVFRRSFETCSAHGSPLPGRRSSSLQAMPPLAPKANIKLIKQLNRTNSARDWHVVFAISGTWKTVDDQAVKHLVRHLPRRCDQRTWILRLSTRRHRKASWVYATRLCLRDIGDVTVVLSTTGRNVSPANTKLLVTNLPRVTARHVVWLYQNRWSVELVNRDLQSALGMGDHQVRGGHDRLEKSCGIAILASLFVLRVCHHEIAPGQPWSVSGLQHTLRLWVITNQVAHNVKTKLATGRKASSYLGLARRGVGFEFQTCDMATFDHCICICKAVQQGALPR
jgi:hypothetical protein